MFVWRISNGGRFIFSAGCLISVAGSNNQTGHVMEKDISTDEESIKKPDSVNTHSECSP